MKSFSATVRIKASPDAVWKALVDTQQWSAMDSSIAKVDGTPARGSKITIHAKAGRAFPLKVVEFAPSERMTLSGGMPLGLFEGRRNYTLTKQGDGAVEFTMSEAFTGLLAPLITRSIPDLQPAFDEFAANLKKKAESR